MSELLDSLTPELQRKVELAKLELLLPRCLMFVRSGVCLGLYGVIPIVVMADIGQ